MSTDFTKPFQENLEKAGVNVLALPAGKMFPGAEFFDVTFGAVHESTIRPAFEELANNIKDKANLVILRSARISPHGNRPNHVVLSASIAAYNLSDSLKADTFSDFESGFVVPEPESPKINEETGKMEPKAPPAAEEPIIPTPEESSAAATTPLENPIPIGAVPLTARKEEKMPVNQQSAPEHAHEGAASPGEGLNAQGSLDNPSSDFDSVVGDGVVNADVGHVEGTNVTKSKDQGEEKREVESPLDHQNTVINTESDGRINAQGSIEGPGDASDAAAGPGVISGGDVAQQEVYIDDGDSHDVDGSTLPEGKSENSDLAEDNPNHPDNLEQSDDSQDEDENNEDEDEEFEPETDGNWPNDSNENENDDQDKK